MHAFDVLGSPPRRRILELLASNEMAAGEISMVIQREFAMSQPSVSQHLRVLRESGFATVRSVGARRIYRMDDPPLDEVQHWLEELRATWEGRLDALATEVARGKRRRRVEGGGGG